MYLNRKNIDVLGIRTQGCNNAAHELLRPLYFLPQLIKCLIHYQQSPQFFGLSKTQQLTTCAYIAFISPPTTKELHATAFNIATVTRFKSHLGQNVQSN